MAEGVREGFGVGHLASLQPFAIRLEPDMASSFIGLYPIQRGRVPPTPRWHCWHSWHTSKKALKRRGS